MYKERDSKIDGARGAAWGEAQSIVATVLSGRYSSIFISIAHAIIIYLILSAFMIWYGSAAGFTECAWACLGSSSVMNAAPQCCLSSPAIWIGLIIVSILAAAASFVSCRIKSTGLLAHSAISGAVLLVAIALSWFIFDGSAIFYCTAIGAIFFATHCGYRLVFMLRRRSR